MRKIWFPNIYAFNYENFIPLISVVFSIEKTTEVGPFHDIKVDYKTKPW